MLCWSLLLIAYGKKTQIIEPVNNRSTQHSSEADSITRLLFCSMNTLSQMLISDTPVVKLHQNQSWPLKKAARLIQQQTELVSLPHAATKYT